jgi:hypothetical protein
MVVVVVVVLVVVVLVVVVVVPTTPPELALTGMGEPERFPRASIARTV